MLIVSKRPYPTPGITHLRFFDQPGEIPQPLVTVVKLIIALRAEPEFFVQSAYEWGTDIFPKVWWMLHLKNEFSHGFPPPYEIRPGDFFEFRWRSSRASTYPLDLLLILDFL